MKIINIIQTMSLFVFLITSCTTADITSTKNKTTSKTLTAQTNASPPTIEELKADSNVIWMGEVNIDYPLNYIPNIYCAPQKVTLMKNLGFYPHKIFRILKYQISDVNNFTYNDDRLFKKILENCKDMQFYKEATLENLYTPLEVNGILEVDTIIDAYNNFISPPHMIPDRIIAFRMRQIIYYDKKEIAFKSIALAIAPLNYNERLINPSQADLKPLFWIKPILTNTPPSIDSKNIKWAKRTRIVTKFSDIKIIKEVQPIHIVAEIMLEDLRTNYATAKIASSNYSNGINYFTAKEVKGLCSHVDTIIVIEPKTFKEVIKAVTHKMDGKHVKKLRLLQDWVWDNNTNSLIIHYVGFLPSADRVDDHGNLLSSGPIFLRKVDDIP